MKNILPKFGGMIANGFDDLASNKTKLKVYDKCLPFSHGRSAMIWLVNNNNFNSCLMCNYTWPAIPELMKKLKLKIGFYDLYEKSLEKKIQMLDGKVLVIIPVFYGFKPWIDYISLQNKFKNKISILIDGAQTAYSHIYYPIKKNIYVLSCPHKSLGIGDGAILKYSTINKLQKKNYLKLTEEKGFSSIKIKSRKLLNSGNLTKEKVGLKLSKKLEEAWASFPSKRMSKSSYQMLIRTDPKKHKKLRINNFEYMKKNLKKIFKPIDKLDPICPFGYPILFKKREKLLKELYKKRIFATSLWDKNKYITKKYKNSYLYKKNFLALPLDQRYSYKDLDEMMMKIKKIVKRIN